MKYALVIRNIVDVTAKADFKSERRTQLLFGERVQVKKKDGSYSLVIQPDGYEGWAPTAGLCGIAKEDYERAPEAFQMRVNSPVAQVFNEQGIPVKPYFLSYGSIVFPLEENPNGSQRIEIVTPDKIRRWVSREDIIEVPDSPSGDPEELAESILTHCVQFLGAPYIWGGRSALGFDCSGLVQLVYAMHGITLPRDSGPQSKEGGEVARKELRPADLIFSPGHVVVYMGEDSFIHASLGEGGVEINSYDKSAGNYRKDLDKDFKVARRHF